MSPKPELPPAPRAIEKGVPLYTLLGQAAIDAMAANLRLADPSFPVDRFSRVAQDGLEPLGIMARGEHIGEALWQVLDRPFEEAAELLLASLTPPLEQTEDNGLAGFFYLPHGALVASHGRQAKDNAGRDPFDPAMRALYELTRRFTSEFSIRPFLEEQTERTLAVLKDWTKDPDPHVRRLCTEGPRPRLPWGKRLRVFIADPRPCLPILEQLRDDPSPYVRRSVANHLGDIGKDNPELLLDTCEEWLEGATTERKALIRHALRHPDKKGVPRAVELRRAAR